MRDFLGSAPAFKGLDIHPFGDLADAFSSSSSQLHSRQNLFDNIELDETLKKKILEKRSGEGLGAVADDLKLWAYAVKHSVTVNHPMGTLPFSRSGEEEGVLDSELRVKGVEGVRVVDASVFVSCASTFSLFYCRRPHKLMHPTFFFFPLLFCLFCVALGCSMPHPSSGVHRS